MTETADNAQLVDAVETSTTKEFGKCLMQLLQGMNYSLKHRSDPQEITADEPLLVLCPFYSRIVTDIKDATQSLSDCYAILHFLDIPDDRKVVIIIHAKKERSLPTLTTSETLTDEKCKQFKLLLDFAFLVDQGIYPCKMNTASKAKLADFLHSNCRLNQRSGETTVHSKVTVTPTEDEQMRMVTTSSGEYVHIADETARQIEAIKKELPSSFQLYIDKHINKDEIQRYIPDGITVKSSLLDLDRKRAWVIVCEKGSEAEEEVRNSESSSNRKLFIYLDKKNPSSIAMEWKGVIEIPSMPERSTLETLLYILHPRENSVISSVKNFLGWKSK